MIESHTYTHDPRRALDILQRVPGPFRLAPGRGIVADNGALIATVYARRVMLPDGDYSEVWTTESARTFDMAASYSRRRP